MRNTIAIKTHYPGAYFLLSIDNGEWVIRVTNNDEYKISKKEMIQFVRPTLLDINLSSRCIRKNYLFHLQYNLICLENLRDIHERIINDLIGNNDAYESNKIGAFGYLKGNTKPVRLKYMEKSKKHPRRFEFISTNKYNKNDPSMITWFDYKKRFKYFIDLPGHSYTTKLYTMLFCKRLVFYIKNDMRFTWERNLKPWVHYVPVNENLRDLNKKYLWAEKNPDKVKKIVETAFDYMMNNLHPDIILNKFGREIEARLS